MQPLKVTNPQALAHQPFQILVFYFIFLPGPLLETSPPYTGTPHFQKKKALANVLAKTEDKDNREDVQNDKTTQNDEVTTASSATGTKEQ